MATVRLFDFATGVQLGEPLPIGPIPADPATQGDYFQVAGYAASNPDGTRFITAPAGPGESVVLWDVNLADWEAMACRIAGRNLSRTEWDQYLPGQPYRVTCPQWPAGT